FDAFVADEHGRTGNQLAHLMLALAAEAAIERVLAVAAGRIGHQLILVLHRRPGRSAGRPPVRARRAAPWGWLPCYGPPRPVTIPKTSAPAASRSRDHFSGSALPRATR